MIVHKSKQCSATLNVVKYTKIKTDMTKYWSVVIHITMRLSRQNVNNIPNLVKQIPPLILLPIEAGPATRTVISLASPTTTGS